MKQQWTMRGALFFLIGTTSCTLVFSIGAFWLWKNYRNDKLTNDKYRISAIIQTGPEKEALKTAYLAEILNLSSDRPSQLYTFDIKQAEAKLLASPLIKSAKVKRLPPSTLYIDYEVRKPIAYLADFNNTAVDSDGYLFPIEPFFPPKRIPSIYLGVSKEVVDRVQGPQFNIALDILKFLESAPWEEGLSVLTIDVSKALVPSLGQREIVLTTEEEITVRKKNREFVCVFPKIIRLSPKDYSHQLVNFFQLQKTMMHDYQKQLYTLNQGGRFSPRIVDLRIPQLAFVEKGS